MAEELEEVVKQQQRQLQQQQQRQAVARGQAAGDEANLPGTSSAMEHARAQRPAHGPEARTPLLAGQRMLRYASVTGPGLASGLGLVPCWQSQSSCLQRQRVGLKADCFDPIPLSISPYAVLRCG